MLEWSTYFQTPRYLDLYRKITMVNDFKPIITKWIGLKDEMNILDVGCGTGAFCFYLSTETGNSTFTGIDIDKTFIEKAREKAANNMSKNHFNFCIGNALELSFQDNIFDLVISYTVLTNLPNGKRALEEMWRVVKPGGSVVSVTTQSFHYFPGFEGYFPSSFNYYYPEYKFYRNKMDKIYEMIQPLNEYLKYGTQPEKIPLLFADSKLKEIKMYPLAHTFSLSNAIYTKEQKESYIRDMYLAELEKFHNYFQLPIAEKYISSEEAKRYEWLLKEHRDMLLKHIDENEIWEWFGGSQLIICGTK